MSVTSIQNVFKVYPNDRKALNGVSLRIGQGEVVGLIGVNGSGKTTLSSIIAGLIPLTSGDVLYNGQSIYKNLPEYRKLIGLCPQKMNLDKRITVRENLFNDAKFFGYSDSEANSRLDEVVDKLMLNEYLDSYPDTLSGGYKQRVLIGRALMHKPKLVILDEPTLGLDPHIRKKLWDLILELKKDDISILLTTHYMDEAEHLSDNICLLKEGAVQFFGTVAEFKGDKTGGLEDIVIGLSQDE